MLAERAQGLLLFLAGCLSLILLYLAQQAGWFQPPVRPPLPPGLRPDLVPVLTPLFCLLPMIALGAFGLCFVGLRKMLAPEGGRRE